MSVDATNRGARRFGDRDSQCVPPGFNCSIKRAYGPSAAGSVTMPRQPPIVLLAAVVLLAAPLAHGEKLYVANNGVDSTFLPCPPGSCVSKESPCRSITCAIRSAAPGDTIVVGPGRYGDLNNSGALGDTAGEEIPGPGCGCMLLMDKAVSLTSSDGAGATLIDALRVGDANGGAAIVIYTNGGEFGRVGKGFTVTNTAYDDGKGIVVDSQNVAIRGNQLVAVNGATNAGIGIDTVDFPETITIEGNQLIGWSTAIRARGDGKLVRSNELSLNSVGINISGSSRAEGNVIVGSAYGAEPKNTAAIVGNAFYGGRVAVNAQPGFAGVIQRNNFIGSRDDCALTNLSNTDGLVVTNDYWGAATGPGPDPADNFCDFLGTSRVVPFAPKPFSVKAA